jgi:hypothetical protein
VGGVVAADSYQVELDLLKAQQTWINRINSLFTCSLGLLAGMSVLHIILISYINDQSRFVDLYSPFSMIFNLFLLILANFSMVLGVAIALIYKQKSEEKLRNLDHLRHSLRLHYTITCFVSFVILVGVCAMFALPAFTN